MDRKFPVAVVCGSMRYFDGMLKLAALLTGDGWIVLMPYVADYIGGQEADDRKRMLDEMHFRKIDMSDRVFIVGEHVGESTSREWDYAREHGKTIIYIADPMR